MFITSKSKIVPFAYKECHDLRVEPLCLDCECSVAMQTNHDENVARGELVEMRIDQLNEGVNIDKVNDVCSAAKILMKLRPELSEEYPAAVVLYNPTKEPHLLKWLLVDQFGQIEPFFNVPKVDVPENGATLDEAPHNRIFYDPVGAIAALRKDVIDEIDVLREETKVKEENDQARADAKKPLIDLINKCQQF